MQKLRGPYPIYPIIINLTGVVVAASYLAHGIDLLWYIGFGLVIISIPFLIRGKVVEQRRKKDDEVRS